MINKIKTKAEVGKLDIDLLQFLINSAKNELGGKCFLIVYKYNEIYLGLINNNTIMKGYLELNRVNVKNELNINHILDLRMFCEKGELHLWKYNDTLQWRLRKDGEGEDCDIYEEDHYIWGTKISDEDEFSIIEECRGMQLTFPFSLKEQPLPLKYKVRNYIKYDGDGLINFIDSRIVHFINNNGGVLNS